MLHIAEQSGCVITVSRTFSGLYGPNTENVVRRVAGSNHPGQAGADTCGALALGDNGPWSCSGVILDHSLGIVLCHGAIFSPFLSLPVDTAWSERQLLQAEDFSLDLNIQVQYVGSGKVSRNSGSGKSMEATNLQLIPLSNQSGVPSDIQQCQARLLLLVPCLEFHNTFSMLFHQADNWQFCSPDEEQESVTLQTALAHLHWFAVLQIPVSCIPGMGILTCMQASELQKGKILFTCGSPFGSFYPDIFINSVSKGVVSNLAGKDNAVILTDSRCLPGTEGGGVFAVQGDSLKLVGLIVAPLCWKAGEWVGLTLVCSVKHILESLEQVLALCRDNVCLSLLPVTQQIVSTTVSPTPEPCLIAAVVLIECDRSWGSGVLLNPRLVVTCRHVVAQTSNIRVYIHGNKRCPKAEKRPRTRTLGAVNKIQQTPVLLGPSRVADPYLVECCDILQDYCIYPLCMDPYCWWKSPTCYNGCCLSEGGSIFTCSGSNPAVFCTCRGG
ncbi:peroxisomal leader peptide-processing protease isoform X2 [Microcaecilia unicolor]|uniref:Peroxisomal leader peptide-processing protease n=1 Tax=Microcaecilia unicolor TaxID=1415580 RepID=A0A6P7Y3E2_9AMPH|nr:peroxisomal leader peptide-processing protease isoform X2 [Microcaecilia unicolor]